MSDAKFDENKSTGDAQPPNEPANFTSEVDSNSVTTQRTFSCRICFEPYSRDLRYPISLNCGHTFCVVCIRELSRRKMSIICGVCRKHTFSNYKRLGKNFTLLDILERNDLLVCDSVVREEMRVDERERQKRDAAGARSIADRTFRLDADAFADDDDGWGEPNAIWNSDYSSSFWVSNTEMEDFYNTLECIQDALYGFTFGQMPAQMSTNTQELTRIRSEMETIVANMRRQRRSFHDVFERARRLAAEVYRQETSNAERATSADRVGAATLSLSRASMSSATTALPLFSHPASTTARSDSILTGDVVSGAAAGGGNGRRTPLLSFYDVTSDLEVPIISFSIDDNREWDSARLSNNFMDIDSTDPNLVTCYLCDARFYYTPLRAEQHIRGRRHRDLLRINYDTNNNGSINFDETSWATNGNNRNTTSITTTNNNTTANGTAAYGHHYHHNNFGRGRSGGRNRRFPPSSGGAVASHSSSSNNSFFAYNYW